MADFFAKLEGNLASTVELYIPATGAWVATVGLAAAVELSGQVTLTLGDMSLLGTVFRGGVYAGAASYQVIGGYNGWSRELQPKGYAKASGVKASTVLTDAARECGEHISVTSDIVAGPSYVRERGPALRCFGGLGIASWYVANDGVTTTGTRPTASLKSGFQVLAWDKARGSASIATEAPSAIAPGVSLRMPDGSDMVVASIVCTASKGAFRIEAMS